MPVLQNMDLHEAFLAAQSAVGQSSSPASDQQKLLLYAYFKQATCGPARGSRPGMFDFRGRAKWDHWAALGAMDTESAKREYLNLADTHAPGWRPLQDDERESPNRAAHGDCQKSADEDQDIGAGTSSASTEDIEQAASSQGIQSSSVSDVDEEHAFQHPVTWRRFSGLYREDLGGTDCDVTVSDHHQTADEVSLATTEDKGQVAKSQGMRSSVSGVNGQHTISWRQFSGLYRHDVRFNVDLPATAPLSWVSDGDHHHGDKSRASCHF